MAECTASINRTMQCSKQGSVLVRALGLVARRHSTIAGGAICGERNHERFNCEPLASSAHSRRHGRNRCNVCQRYSGRH